MTLLQHIDRLACKLEIILCGHILNPFWKGRRQRRIARYRVQSDALSGYFAKYYLCPLPDSASEKENAPATQKIFTIWLQGENNEPAHIRACIDSMRRNSGLPVEVYDEQRLCSELDLPQVIWNKYRSGKIRHAHFADICRLALLRHHGGYWMDATLFVTAPIPQEIASAPFFVYLAFNEGLEHYSLIQNCFIKADKNSPLLNAWHESLINYWTAENNCIDYFQHQMMFRTMVEKDYRAAELFNQMPQLSQEPTHRLWWECRNEPFSKELWTQTTGEAFFQKTAYKSDCRPIPGSIYDHILNDRTL